MKEDIGIMIMKEEEVSTIKLDANIIADGCAPPEDSSTALSEEVIDTTAEETGNNIPSKEDIVITGIVREHVLRNLVEGTRIEVKHSGTMETEGFIITRITEW